MDSIRDAVTAALAQHRHLSDVSAAFARLSTNRARVVFFLQLPASQLASDSSLPSVTSDKSVSHSEAVRRKGNAAFSKGEHVAALRFYSEAVSLAPLDANFKIAHGCEDHELNAATMEGVALAFAYANRSAVLVHLQQYGAALADVWRALRHGYPADLAPKLNKRATRIGHLAAQQCARGTLPSDWEHRIAVCQGDVTKAALQNVIWPDDPFYISDTRSLQSPPDIKQKNALIQCADACVEIQRSEERGRHLVVNRQINPGEVMIVEPAFSLVLLNDQCWDHCHHCSHWTPAPLPCAHCCQARYCSRQCAASAWQLYHRLECGELAARLAALDCDRMALLATRTVLQLVSGRTTNDATNGATKKCCQPTPTSGVYRSDDYERVAELETHAGSRNAGDLFRRTVTAVVLSRVLVSVLTKRQQQTSSLDDNTVVPSLVDKTAVPSLVDKTPVPSLDDKTVVPSLVDKTPVPSLVDKTAVPSLDDNTVVPSLVDDTAVPSLVDGTASGVPSLIDCATEILTLLQSLPCNAHSVCEQLVPTAAAGGAGIGQVTSRETAAGVYPLLSLANHSCAPNVWREYHGTRAVLRALRPLRAGDELLDNYGYHYALMERDQRRLALARQYHFKCACTACCDDTPCYLAMDGAAAACCRRCSAVLAARPPPSSAEITTDRRFCQCAHTVMTPQGRNATWTAAKVADELATMRREVLHALHEGVLPDRQRLAWQLRLVDSVVRTPWRQANDAQETFKMCFLLQANTCRQYAEKS